jgi:hypothetical protein
VVGTRRLNLSPDYSERNEPQRHRGHKESTLRPTERVSKPNSLFFLFLNSRRRDLRMQPAFAFLGALVVNNPG